VVVVVVVVDDAGRACARDDAAMSIVPRGSRRVVLVDAVVVRTAVVISIQVQVEFGSGDTRSDDGARAGRGGKR